MSEHRAPPSAVRDWFRRDVESKLADAVGGLARLRIVVLLAAVLGLQSADSATVGAVAAPLERGLGIGNTQVGLLVAVSTAVGAVATLPAGVLADRVRRTRLLTIAILVWSAAMVVSGFAVSFAMLLVTRLALGAVVAIGGPAVASLTGDFFPAAERGRIYGFILSGELLGAGFGFLVAGNVAGVVSWRASFVVLAIPSVILAAAIAKLLPEPARGGQSRLSVGATDIVSAEDVEDGGPADAEGQSGEDAEPGAPDEGQVAEEVEEAGIRPHQRLVLHTDPVRMPLPKVVRYVLSIRTNVVLITASALGYFYFSGLKTFAVQFLRGRFGLGQSAGSTLLVVVGAGAIIGVLLAGRVADRLIGRGHLAARPLVAAVAFLAAAGLFLAGLLTTTLLIAVALFFLAAAALGGTNPPLDAARLDIMQHHLWGRAEAVRTFFRSLFEAAAPLVFGYVSTLFGGHGGGLGGSTGRGSTPGAPGLDMTLLVMLVPLVIGGIVLLYARRTYPRDVATAIASERDTGHDDS